MQLRPYQLSSIDSIKAAFAAGHKRVILALTTGAGKTAVAGEMVRQAAFRGTCTLVITDRVELFKQMFAAIGRVNVTPHLISPNSKRFDSSAVVYVAMVETLARRQHLPLNPKLIILDECHKGNFSKIIDRFPDAYVIGATATPVGKHLFKYYTHIVQEIDTPDLIEQGYLVPCRGFEMKDDFSDLKIRAGKYTEESLFNHYNKRKLYDGMIDKWRQVAADKKTIVFCVNIEHTEKTYQAFIDAGVTAEFVTSETPDAERDRKLAAFRLGLVQVMVNCGILTTGYDEPSIECVVMNRKTLSLPLWLQCCGRGSRLHPGKTHFIVIDMGQNFTFHGLWDEPRKWELKPPSKKKLSHAPMKLCPSCEAMLTAAARSCQWCGYQFEISAQPLAVGELVEVKSKTAHLIGLQVDVLTEEDLFSAMVEKKFKPTYIWRVIRSRGESSIKKFANLAGYSRGWVYHQMQKINDNEYKSLTLK